MSLMINNNRPRDLMSFRSDPAVSTGSASPDDYLRSGYDKGNLLPTC